MTSEPTKAEASATYFFWERLGEVMAKDWWLLALRGVFGVIFGIIALGMPIATLLALVLLFSAYMLVDGFAAVATAIRAMRRYESWGMPLLMGILNLVIGAVAFLWPAITVLAFVLQLAVWSVISGVLMLAGAYNIETPYGRGWLIFGGLLSLLFGVLLMISPLMSAIVLTWYIGTYALVFGVCLIVLAFRLRSQRPMEPAFRSAQSMP